MSTSKQTKETDDKDARQKTVDLGGVQVVVEPPEPAGTTVAVPEIEELKAQLNELKELITDAKAEALADSEALADRVAALEQPVVVTDSMPQFEELKGLISDSRAFTHEVHDAVVAKLTKAEAATTALARQVAAITPIPRNYPRTKEYTVKPGETLVMIAKVQLGQPGRMTEIATTNYDRYPSLRTSSDIKPGWILRLPA